MKKYINLVLIAFMFSGCFQGSSDTTRDITTLYPLKDYQQDFDKMVDILLKNHPQPYAFISKDSLENLIDAQYRKITDSTSLGGFLWICLEVVSAINCGHTMIWSSALNNFPKSAILPLHVKFVGSKLYIVDTWENSTHLNIGDEVLTINGVEAGSLREEIFQHIPSDILSESYKHEYLNLLFGVYFALYFDFPTSYIVTVLKNGKVEEVKLTEGENFDGKKTYLDNCENRLCFNTDEESKSAIMTIRSFAYYKKDMPIFKSFIDSCFIQIKENNIENLIIDLRNNGGGDPFCGSYLMQYIADKPYTYFHKDVKRYADLKKPIQPNANRFHKKPYILTNGMCFSTTGHFCSLVKENNFGIFIGDETGATYTCNDNSKMYTLKNTRLQLKVARNTYKTTASSLSKSHGIIPDHYVIPGIDDILINSDTVLNYTLKLLEKE